MNEPHEHDDLELTMETSQGIASIQYQISKLTMLIWLIRSMRSLWKPPPALVYKICILQNSLNKQLSHISACDLKTHLLFGGNMIYTDVHIYIYIWYLS
ncbi:unnamed protein product, partial [Prunus brigantina]